MPRVISFEKAKAQYVHRYTMEHVPAWARKPLTDRPIGDEPGPRYYAPQFRSDWEWYCNTMFPGEGFVGKREKHCYTSGQTWPLGQWLNAPYHKGQIYA